MKTLTLFLLSVICFIYYGLKPNEFFCFRVCLNIALRFVYFFILLLCYWAAGTINLFSMHIYITDYLCFAYNTSTFVATECCCTGINLSLLQGNPLF